MCDAWRVVSSPGVTPTFEAQLLGVSAVSTNDVWAVGYASKAGAGNTYIYETLIQHWNGSAWTRVTSPNVADKSNQLLAVDARASNDVWAVGHYLTEGNFPEPRTLIEHWNGSAWSIVPSPNRGSSRNDLFDVVALSSNDAWAVGNATNDQDRADTLTLHWDGTAWNVVASPSVTPAGDYASYLKSVSATSPNDIWAVGYHHEIATTHQGGLILHWNGAAWTRVTEPSVSDFHYFFAVQAITATDAWLLGDRGFGPVLFEHWNGTEWSIVPGADVGDSSMLLDLAAISANDIWAVGVREPASYYSGTRTLVEHWDGTVWSEAPSPNVAADEQYHGNQLAGVAAVSSKDVWAVGEYHVPDQNPQPLIVHYSTGLCSTAPPTFTPLPSATPTRTPIPTVVGCGLEFADVPPDYTFYPYARCLTCKESISGYGCGGNDPWTGEPEPCDEDHKPYFRPGNPVSRGQIAKMVSQSAGFKEPAGEQIYEDVLPGSTFYDFVQRLSHRAVMGGYPCGQPDTEPCVAPANRPNFRPETLATRGHISKIVSNAAGFEDEPTTQKFEDVPPDNPFYLWVERLGSRQVMGGYPCGTVDDEPCVGPEDRPYFRYGRTVTRGQAAKIVANTFFPNCDLSTPTPTPIMTAAPTVTPSTARKLP
jgi:hypothetical protein